MEQHISQEETRRIIINDMVKKRISIVPIIGDDVIVYKGKDSAVEISFQEFIASDAPLVIVLGSKEEMDEDKMKTYQKVTRRLQQKIFELEEDIDSLRRENELLKEQTYK